MDRLKNKRALVTGGTSGIGLDTAWRFAAEGARVAITGTDSAKLQRAAVEIGDDVLRSTADAADIAAGRRIARALEDLDPCG